MTLVFSWRAKKKYDCLKTVLKLVHLCALFRGVKKPKGELDSSKWPSGMNGYLFGVSMIVLHQADC